MISKIAEDENITPEHITHYLDLGFVSPKVLNAILAGQQKPELRTRKISKLKFSPIWEDQDAVFLEKGVHCKLASVPSSRDDNSLIIGIEIP